MTSANLGSLRRTHYSDTIDASHMDGSEVTVMGWVQSVRVHGNISFVTIRDMAGEIPIVAKKGSGGCPDDVRETLSSLKPHSSIAVRGTVKSSDKTPRGFEIVPSETRVFSSVKKIPPFEPMAKTVKNIDTRLAARPIDLRRAPLQHMFRARSAVLRSVREYFADEDFMEINTPKVISSATEGGAMLFAIFYYNTEAFLAQSPQLYKEQLTMSFEKVFEIGPIFRAEPSRTNRHLAEAISIDLEEAFVDYNDVMDRLEGIIKKTAQTIRDYTAEHPDSGFVADVQVPDSIPRHTYGELISAMQDKGIKAEWGDDLHPHRLAKIGLEGYYFITDWPMGPKPFYVKPSELDPNISESFDLMFGDLELSSGSTRISDAEELAHRLGEKGMDVKSFTHHLGAFDYGVPPHAGCGIGLERLMMALTGTENIRDATFYPRDIDRLTP